MRRIVCNLGPARSLELNNSSRCRIHFRERNILGIRHACSLKCLSPCRIKVRGLTQFRQAQWIDPLHWTENIPVQIDPSP